MSMKDCNFGNKLGIKRGRAPGSREMGQCSAGMENVSPSSIQGNKSEINGLAHTPNTFSESEEFVAMPLRTWTSLRGERARENTRSGFRGFMYNQKKRAISKAKWIKKKGSISKEG